MNTLKAIFIFLGLLTSATTLAAQAPFIDPANDPEFFGVPDDILFWTPEQQVAGYRNMDKLVSVRWVRAGDSPLLLPEKPVDLGPVLLADNPDGMTVDQYLEQKSVAGLLVIKDGAIVYERYRLGNNAQSRWISYSVTKSVVSMLVGAAIRDGYIKSIDEKVTDYLPRLQGSGYEHASIKDILQMASGVEWDETYSDPEADINQVIWDTLELYEYLANKKAVEAPGQRFNYNTAESNLVGTLLRSAIGNNLSVYLEEKIWRPFGMESDASWNLTEEGGGEFGGCCINATLRDYGRLGLFALNNGRLLSGKRVLPKDWMQASTTPSAGNSKYGYLWWLGEEGVFAASGIFGQAILVNPEQNLVIAMHSARPDASKAEDWDLQANLFRAIVRALEEK